MLFAHAAMTDASDIPPWLRASLFEGLARAAAVAGDGLLRAENVAAAHAALAEEPVGEAHSLILAQIEDVPPV